MAGLILLRRLWWAIPLLILLAHDRRVDHLRGVYRNRWQTVTAEYAAFKTRIIDRTAERLVKEKVQAREADENHERQLVDARDATARYIAAHRVRRPTRNDRGPAAAPADPGISQEMPADPYVAVADADVQACTEAVTIAVDAYNWANAPDPANIEGD